MRKKIGFKSICYVNAGLRSNEVRMSVMALYMIRDAFMFCVGILLLFLKKGLKINNC